VPRYAWEKQPRKVLAEIRRRLRFPVFVKPATLGSSVGISKVSKTGELTKAMNTAAKFGQKIVVERGLDAREIEVSVLGNAEPEASLPGEVLPRREFYDYTAKYLEDSTDFVIPAKLPAATVRRLQHLAVEAFRTTECEGMARADFLLAKRGGKVYLNELNTIPGFTPISMYPKLWEVSGLPYAKLLDRLIQLALERHRQKRRTRFTIDLPRKRGGVMKE
jgi:D-alanine-D-alanine ligase